MAFVAGITAAGSLTACGQKSDQQAEAAADSGAATFVVPLAVRGTALVARESGDTMVLTGPSLGWHTNWGRFYNDSTLRALRTDWKATITRAAIGAHDSGDCIGGYDTDSAKAVGLAMAAIDGAIANDMYVICDWHSHHNTKENAKKFFATIAGHYGNTPNIIYEIWNEPLEVSWDEVKEYASEVIDVIRAEAPDAVVIVGTPSWDQDVDVAALSPLDKPDVLYALHYYAATHKDWNREKADTAIARGLPLIVSESGGMLHTGDGPVDTESWQAWMDWADRNRISVLMWDIADKDESCSMLVPTASDFGTSWSEADLKEWGKTARRTSIERNTKFNPEK